MFVSPYPARDSISLRQEGRHQLVKQWARCAVSGGMAKAMESSPTCPLEMGTRPLEGRTQGHIGQEIKVGSSPDER